MSDLGYSLVPVDHDPFADQLPPSQGVATTQTTAQPDEIAKLAGQGTYLTVENQKPKVTYDEAKANLYGLTGIPDIQKGVEEFGKGNYLAGIGQAGYGALNAASWAYPGARLGLKVGEGVLKEALPAITEVLANTEGTFLGTKARLANLDTQARAKALEDQGMRNEDIRKATGWFRGIDDQWRFEHSDLGGKITGPNYYDALDRAKRSGTLPTIGDLYSDPKLWENYPEIAKYHVDESNDPRYVAAFSPVENKFRVGSAVMESSELKSVLQHEIQHAIQEKEGFAIGGNPRAFLPSDHAQNLHSLMNNYDFATKGFGYHNINEKDAVDTIDKVVRGDLPHNDPSIPKELHFILGITKKYYDKVSAADQAAYKQYNNLAGETEARLVQQRSTLGPQAIKDISPFPVNSPPINKLYSYDVPPAEQVVRYGSPENANQLQASEKPKNILGPVAAGGYTWPGGKPIIGYHGTPYTFEPTEKNSLGEFDLSKFGTGEGGELFGYGINQATDRAVANWYKKFLESRGDEGHIYQSQMFLKPEDALGYHKSEQSPYVQKILSGMPEIDEPVQTGGQIYQNLVDKLGSTKAASERLLEAGIPGIRAGGNIISPRNGIMYYDPDNKRPNYVIFSPQLINIVKKYGIGALISSGYPLGTYAIPVDYQPDFGSLR